MRRNGVVKGILLLVVIFFVVSMPMLVYANSAQTKWKGIDATGAMVVEEDCPIVVESELLTFDLQEFPSNYYDSIEAYLNYSGKVTAEYTLYNPADYTVTATLLFPFGKVPDYGCDYDRETGERVTNADAWKYGISVNDQEVEVKLRHTLSMHYDQFDLEQDLPLVVDGYVKDSFYHPDIPVYCVSYTISGIDEKYSAATVALEWSGDDTKTKILVEDHSGGELLKDSVRISRWADNGDQIKVWIIGEYQELPEWTLYENGACEKKIAGTVEKDTKEIVEKMTFKDYVMQGYDSALGILESDWYNAKIASLKESEWMYGVISRWDYSGDLSNALLRWYEYEITLAPGERIVNTVTAPIYPAINLSYNPSIFSYTYLLSPAQTWSEFGSLEVVIHTPFFITDSSLDGFKKTENGYSLSLSGLPEGELEFTLSTSENPIPPAYSRGSVIPTMITFVILLIGIVVVIKFVKRIVNGEKYDN